MKDKNNYIRVNIRGGKRTAAGGEFNLGRTAGHIKKTLLNGESVVTVSMGKDALANAFDAIHYANRMLQSECRGVHISAHFELTDVVDSEGRKVHARYIYLDLEKE